MNDTEILAALDCDEGDLNIMFVANKVENQVESNKAFFGKVTGKEKAAVNTNGVELVVGETTEKEFIEKMSEFDDITVENGGQFGDETEIICSVNNSYMKLTASVSVNKGIVKEVRFED